MASRTLNGVPADVGDGCASPATDADLEAFADGGVLVQDSAKDLGVRWATRSCSSSAPARGDRAGHLRREAHHRRQLHALLADYEQDFVDQVDTWWGEGPRRSTAEALCHRGLKAFPTWSKTRPVQGLAIAQFNTILNRST
jgi:hypothetical protein